MEYEIVNLKQKTLVGLSARTSNDSLDMGNVIGGLWGNFYTGGIHEQIKNRVNEFAIGLYSDYTEDKKGYCITVGNEVSNVDENNKDLAWQQIWDMDLDRSFTGDFEEYKNSEVENAEIDIYVALK